MDPTASLAAVQVMDCGVFLLGDVTFLNEKTTLVGALGEWYVLASATSSWALPARRAAEASRGALESLSRMMVKPEPSSDGTLEGLVREMLRPMLREWLDAHLPEMVEAMVAKEIARITREGR